ncbi:MAG: peptidylprolyl isomerase [Thiotrichales bacterium]
MNLIRLKSWAVAIALALIASHAAAEVRWLDRIVAVAGQDVVTETELRASLNQIVRELRARNTTPPSDAVLVKQVLDRIILDKLQQQRADALGIRIDDITLDRAVQNIAGENNMTVSQFRESLERDGIPFQSFRDKVRTELATAQLQRREVDNRVTVSEQEITDLIAKQNLGTGSTQEYRVSHILIAVPEAANPAQIEAAQQQATEVRRRAAAGEDFGQLAVAHSKSQQALQGGDLGWRAADQLPTIFADQILQLAPQGVSEVIRSGSGFHIVKLMDKRGGQSGPQITQTRARHILLKTTEVRDVATARQQLQDYKRRVQAGEDFSALARRFSEDTGSAVEGGELGWNAVGAFVPEFEETLARLRPGEIAEPIQTRFGWHLIQLMERRQTQVADDTLRSRARELISRQKREEELELWLRRLRDESFVEYRIGQSSGS